MSKFGQLDFNPEFELLGPWEAQVVERDDKQDQQGKITVLIPLLFGEEKVLEVAPKFGVHSWDVPQVGQWTWVEFRHLDRDLPMYYGAWWPDDKKLPDANGSSKRHVYQIVDQNGAAEWSVLVDREANKTEIRLDKAGCIITFDEATKELRIDSDKNKGDMAPVKINAYQTSEQVARRWDKIRVVCPICGIPGEGMIFEGSRRVLISNDKSIL